MLSYFAATCFIECTLLLPSFIPPLLGLRAESVLDPAVGAEMKLEQHTGAPQRDVPGHEEGEAEIRASGAFCLVSDQRVWCRRCGISPSSGNNCLCYQ